MKRGPRWWHHLRATVGGYFWLPCPVCGRPFGGHEWRSGETIHDDASEPWKGRAVCSEECCGRWEADRAVRRRS